MSRCTRALPALILLATVLPAQAQVLRVDLRGAAPEAVGRELEKTLRAPVEVRGGAGRTVTLNLIAASPQLILDRVAALMGGSWRMKLRVVAGQPGVNPSPSPRPALERNIAVGIQDLPAQRAFALAARELRADLEVEGELDRRLTVPPANRPVNVFLDQLAEQAGATWSIRYVIHAADAPPPPPLPEPEPEIPAAPVNPRPITPMPTPTRVVWPKPVAAPSAQRLRTALWADINQLVRAEPSRRGAAVQEFVSTVDQRFAALNSLSPAERALRLRAAQPVLKQWRRLYQGLAPSLKAQLAPAAQLLERNLG